MANTLVYLLDKKIYINLTNRCTNDCIFCLRKDKDDVVGQKLWLDDENSTAKDVIQQFETFEPTNFVYKRNVIPELKGLIDEFSVSLNGATKEEYNELSQPKFDEAYEEVKKFIKACADENISVVASVVEGYKGRHLDLKTCEKIATDLGAKFRVREWIVNGY